MSETRLTYKPIMAPDLAHLNSQLITVSLAEINGLRKRVSDLEKELGITACSVKKEDLT